jgi:hypothetical protein
MKTVFSALLLAASAIFAAPPSYPVPLATFRAEVLGAKGDSAALRVRVVIPKGWHIQSDAPLDDFLIPTEVMATGEGLEFGKPSFPKPLMKEFPALGGKVALFEDTVEVRVPVKRAKGFKSTATALGESLKQVQVTLRYQACNDSQCLPPKVIAARYVPKGG